MTFIKKAIFSALAMLPIASISAVAHAKMLEAEGEEQSNLLEDEAVNARRLLMPLGAMSISVEDSKAHLAQQTGITDDKALDEEFQRQVKILIDKGIVQKDEKMLMSSGPSRW